jgi:hypothetical protein
VSCRHAPAFVEKFRGRRGLFGACRARVLELVVRLFAATDQHATAMGDAGLDVSGTLNDLLGRVDVIVDGTPKRIAAKNVET